MKDSILWKPFFIPVYFLVGILYFALFKFIIDVPLNLGNALLPLFVFAIGIASIVYNFKKNKFK